MIPWNRVKAPSVDAHGRTAIMRIKVAKLGKAGDRRLGAESKPAPDRGPSLGQVVPRFLDFCAAIDRSAHTQETLRIDLALLARFLGNPPIGTIGLDDLRRYGLWLRRERHNDDRSIRRKVASVKAFFGYLHQSGLRDDDPAEALIYPILAPHLPEILEDAEAERLIAAAGERLLWRALILLLLEAGLKRDEVLALHPADISFDPSRPERGRLIIRATNQARRVRARRLPLTPRLADALERHLATGIGERVFPISARAINFAVETCGIRAGLRKRGAISPQMLRDTFATRAVRPRLIEEERQRRAGASDLELAQLRARHDLEVCGLLGLIPNAMNDPIARYRVISGG